jgi:hypothetical protein
MPQDGDSLDRTTVDEKKARSRVFTWLSGLLRSAQNKLLGRGLPNTSPKVAWMLVIAVLGFDSCPQICPRALAPTLDCTDQVVRQIQLRFVCTLPDALHSLALLLPRRDGVAVFFDYRSEDHRGVAQPDSVPALSDTRPLWGAHCGGQPATRPYTRFV